MNRHKLIVALALTVATALASCNRKTVYNHYQHTSAAGWEKDDTLTFEGIAIPEGGVYTEEIGLRTGSDYPFQSLTFIIEQTVSPSGDTRSETFTAHLMSEDGETLGHGVSLYQYRFPFRSLTLQEGDTLSIRIHHDMKRETLPGIFDVGMKLRRQ